MSQPTPTTVQQANPQGSLSSVELSQGTIQYSDEGDGDPIVFLHGALTNGNLWRNVTAALAPEYRCLAPTFPLGGHDGGMHPDADLSPPGLAALLAEFLDALGLQRVTLVGNDLGGAYCQLFLADSPERVERLVLTNCDAFENFPARIMAPFVQSLRVPGVTTLLARALGLRTARRLTVKLFASDSIDPAVIDGYLDALQTNPAVRRDLRKVMLGGAPEYTTAAAASFPSFERPVLVVWGVEDPVFPIDDAQRLAEAFPNARLEQVDDASMLVPEDDPERLVDHLRTFLDSASPSDPKESVTPSSPPHS